MVVGWVGVYQSKGDGGWWGGVLGVIDDGVRVATADVVGEIPLVC